MSKDITVTVSIPEMNMILQAMQTLPINPGLQLLQKVENQANAQVQEQIKAEQAAQLAAEAATKKAQAFDVAEPTVSAAE